MIYKSMFVSHFFIFAPVFVTFSRLLQFFSMASSTTGAPANNPVDGGNGEEGGVVMNRSVSVFRCLFPHGWEDSSQESHATDATDDSHAGSQPTDDESNVREYNPEVPTFAVDSTPEPPTDSTPEVPAQVNDSTPEEPAPADNPPAAPAVPVTADNTPAAPDVTVTVTADNPAASERPPTSSDNPADPDTPATPENSSLNVDATHVGNDSTSSSTNGSQAHDAGDVSFDTDTLEHDEYKEIICKRSEGSRRIVRNSSRPTLWRHQRYPKASLCLYDAVDDGICIVKTGLIWSIDGKLFEIVFVSSLGWVPQKARRSHRVTYSTNPIYVVVRDASLQGQIIHFHQLLKLVAATVFREGRACSVVNFDDVNRAKQLANDFMEKHERNYEAWLGITYMRTRKELEAKKKEEEERQRLLQEEEEARTKRAQEREEANRKRRELRDLKRKEEAAHRAAMAAARKTAKAEKQKRDRKFKREVKLAVLSCIEKLEKDLEDKLVQCVDTSRAEIEADLGHRLAQCEDTLENVTVAKSSFESFKTVVDKRFKSMKRKSKRQDKDKSNAENVDPAPPLKRSKSKAWATSNGDKSASEPPVSMSNRFAMIPPPMSDPRTLRMTTHPRADQSSWWVHGHVNPATPTMVMAQRQSNVIGTTPRYMSPVFGQRNYSR